MKHVTFARFPDRDHAAQAIRRIRGSDSDHSVAVLVHTGAHDPVDLENQLKSSGDLQETDLRHALLVGGVLGLLTGAVVGAVLALVGIVPGEFWIGALFGGIMGAMIGLLEMLLIGVGLMDRRLVKLTRGLHAGEVVMTLECPDAESAGRVLGLLRESGAEVAEKSPV